MAIFNSYVSLPEANLSSETWVSLSWRLVVLLHPCGYRGVLVVQPFFLFQFGVLNLISSILAENVGLKALPAGLSNTCSGWHSAHRWPGVRRMASCQTHVTTPVLDSGRQLGVWGQPTNIGLSLRSIGQTDVQWMTMTRCANVSIGFLARRGVSPAVPVSSRVAFRTCHCMEGRPNSGF
jgi:hypothetical protein